MSGGRRVVGITTKRAKNAAPRRRTVGGNGSDVSATDRHRRIARLVLSYSASPVVPLHQPVPQRIRRRRSPALEPQFAEDIGNVGHGRSVTDEQRLADFPVRQPVDE